ncbi:hypothetical protein SDC9_152238 [bioreactor metagenome]|jgi:hypothetical protein|uniref:Uncharacterized protein n=1 Tax=bioreactor metagenome TaxID=1076179 RepID=A0A645EUW3_9ZZZZ
MEILRDCIGRIACKGDASTGLIETLYKGHKTRTMIPIGEKFIIEREDTVTTVTRISNKIFHVESYRRAA